MSEQISFDFTQEKKHLRVLIACEYSGTVREAFKAKGHYALSCDLLPTDIPGEHYQGNILDILDNNWDLMIAHPPCTYLCNSSVCRLYTNKDRWDLMRGGADFFRTLLNANIGMIAVENPIPHKYALEIIGKKYNQIIHPYQFGHLQSKSTCLWLKNLPKLIETNNVKEEMLKLPKSEIHKLYLLPPGPDRWKIRSKTYQGIADAMATQWG